MRFPRFMYDPDDGAPAGDTGADTPAPNPAADTIAAVKSIADSFREEIKTLRTAAAPAPAASQGPDLTALRSEGAEIAKKYNEMCSNGEFIEAQIMMNEYNQRVNAATRGNVDDDPVVKAAVGFGRRAAQKEYSDVFEKWGDEVDAIVKRLPAAERIQPDAWDKAVKEVRMNHFEELVAARESAATEAARQKFVAAPSAPGSRGRSSQNASSNLSEEELFFADLTGVTPERYAFRVQQAEEWAKKPLRERGNLSDGFPLLPDGPVKPGSF